MIKDLEKDLDNDKLYNAVRKGVYDAFTCFLENWCMHDVREGVNAAVAEAFKKVDIEDAIKQAVSENIDCEYISEGTYNAIDYKDVREGIESGAYNALNDEKEVYSAIQAGARSAVQHHLHYNPLRKED